MELFYNWHKSVKRPRSQNKNCNYIKLYIKNLIALSQNGTENSRRDDQTNWSEPNQTSQVLETSGKIVNYIYMLQFV